NLSGGLGGVKSAPALPPFPHASAAVSSKCRGAGFVWGPRDRPPSGVRSSLRGVENIKESGDSKSNPSRTPGRAAAFAQVSAIRLRPERSRNNLDAGYCSSTTTNNQPPPMQQLAVGWYSLGVFDPDVVDVGTTFGNGAATGRPTRNQTGGRKQLADRGQR